MSILSNVTGIGINPFGKRKFKIDPLKALGTAATVASFGGAGPIVGALSHIPGGAAAINAATRLGTAARALPGATKIGAAVAGARRILGSGGGGVPANGVGDPNAPVNLDPNTGLEVMNGPEGGGGGTDWLGIGEGALAGVSALNAAKASGRAGKYQQQALDVANQRWQEGEPLRAAGSQRLLNPTRPDLTQVFNDPTNAFSAPALPPGAAPPPVGAVPVRRKFGR